MKNQCRNHVDLAHRVKAEIEEHGLGYAAARNLARSICCSHGTLSAEACPGDVFAKKTLVSFCWQRSPRCHFNFDFLQSDAETKIWVAAYKCNFTADTDCPGTIDVLFLDNIMVRHLWVSCMVNELASSMFSPSPLSFKFGTWSCILWTKLEPWFKPFPRLAQCGLPAGTCRARLVPPFHTCCVAVPAAPMSGLIAYVGPLQLPAGCGYLTPEQKKEIKDATNCTASVRKRDQWGVPRVVPERTPGSTGSCKRDGDAHAADLGRAANFPAEVRESSWIRCAPADCQQRPDRVSLPQGCSHAPLRR